jgi:hypothetical protein
MADEKRISLRLPTAIHTMLVEQARANRRSLNSEIVHLLEVALGESLVDAESP